MSNKRSRERYEADLVSQQSPYTIFGTPLPPQDPDVRDDGSYVPVWKQEVRDERGLKRLHGAFTGGFSAGYFNTVGSKEGWTPSTFVSSRSNRKKDATKVDQQRPEDFMDEEDIRDAEDARRIETAVEFSGLGFTSDDAHRKSAFIDLFRAEGETIGVKLLQKMGWKEGQGVGPKVRRPALLEENEKAERDSGTTYLFAPKRISMIKFVKKNDHHGLGFTVEINPWSTQGIESTNAQTNEDDDMDRGPLGTKVITRNKYARGGFGVGILNDTGSDEDPYEIGPRISYNRAIGGDKKKKRQPNIGAVNSLPSKPFFISKKTALAKASARLRKCNDGRLPLDGFLLSGDNEFNTGIVTTSKFKHPEIPQGWKSSKQPYSHRANTAYLSTSDTARISKLDPKSRASILGEAILPGKSVFDFLSPAARDRLAAASGKDDLPPALDEAKIGYNMTEEECQKGLNAQIPFIEKQTANAALSRGASGFMPYSEDEKKRSRYRSYLEYQSGLSLIPPSISPGTSQSDWLKELHEFANCARIFKPMTGSMAIRFTSSTSITSTVTSSLDTSSSLCHKPGLKPEDPAEQAAKLSMYGPLTRSTKEWYPTRLLCKRFNVNPPPHVQPGATEHPDNTPSQTIVPDLVPQSAISSIIQQSHLYQQDNEDSVKTEVTKKVPELEDITLDTGWNEALEGQRAGEAVFRAVFGDDSDEED